MREGARVAHSVEAVAFCGASDGERRREGGGRKTIVRSGEGCGMEVDSTVVTMTAVAVGDQ